MHNELNIFLLTNTYFCQTIQKKNTEPFKQTGIWPAVKKSNKMLFKKKYFHRPASPDKEPPGSGTECGQGAKRLLIGRLTSERACVRQLARRGPRAEGSRPRVSYLISHGVWQVSQAA